MSPVLGGSLGSAPLGSSSGSAVIADAYMPAARFATARSSPLYATAR